MFYIGVVLLVMVPRGVVFLSSDLTIWGFISLVVFAFSVSE